MRIYDYVDLHVPKLEQMYHKRLQGYAELGHRFKLAPKENTPSRIYSSQDYYDAFLTDLNDAARDNPDRQPFPSREESSCSSICFPKGFGLGWLCSGPDITRRGSSAKTAGSCPRSTWFACQRRGTGHRNLRPSAALRRLCPQYNLSFSRKHISALRFDSKESCSSDISSETLDKLANRTKLWI